MPSPQGQPADVSLQSENLTQHAGGDAEAETLGTPPGEEQKVSWLELFFDLIFVVAFDQLAKRLGDNASLQNIGVFAFLFVAVWWAWAANATFSARYGNECRSYRWGTVVEVVLIALVALTLRGDMQDTGLYFALAFGANRLLHTGLHLWVPRHTPEAREYSGGGGLGTPVGGVGATRARKWGAVWRLGRRPLG